MKNSVKLKYLFVLGIVFLVALVYRDSFNSRFFQDDAILLKIARDYSPLAVIPNFPYRPIAIQIFYSLQYIFGLNPLGYHIVIYTAFIATLFLVRSIAERLLNDPVRALAVTFFYALNISLFANFYWIANGYIPIGAMFFFLTIYFYLSKKPVSWVLCLGSFLLTALTNELAFVIPVVLVGVGWYLKNFWRRSLLLALGLVDAAFLFWRYFLVGLPTASDYSVVVDGRVPATLRWYILRALNLPEGIRFSGDPLILILFVMFIFLLMASLWHYWQSSKKNYRLILFSGGWFILCALPFFFLPGHMSAHYLTIALFGLALILGEVQRFKTTLLLAGLVYFLLTVKGLEFLSQTHWIILKNTGPIGKF